MPDNGKIEELTENLKSYVNTNIELIKHQAIERATVIIADLVTNALIGLILIFFVFFISLWACLYLSTLLGGTGYLGIVIVAGFYLLIGMILFLARKKLVIRPLRNKIIRNIFQKN